MKSLMILQAILVNTKELQWLQVQEDFSRIFNGSQKLHNNFETTPLPFVPEPCVILLTVHHKCYISVSEVL